METLLLVIAVAASLVVLIMSAELWHQLRASQDRAARIEALRSLALPEDPTMPDVASAAVARSSQLIEQSAPNGGSNAIAGPMFAAAMEPPAPPRRWYILAGMCGALGIFGGILYALW